MTTPKDTVEEFKDKVAQELGYVSALFMSQECKGTEIVMPTEELEEALDRICLYQSEALLATEARVREETLRSVLSNVSDETQENAEEELKALPPARKKH